MKITIDWITYSPSKFINVNLKVSRINKTRFFLWLQLDIKYSLVITIKEMRSTRRFFCRLLGSSFIDKSVEEHDIDTRLMTDTIRQKIRDEFIADATVTVVLIGRCTWQRKHIDWEIGSSLRDTRRNSRCGLLGILLPTHYDYDRPNYSGKLIPPRLHDNCVGKDTFAAIYDWPNPWNATSVQNWIHNAYERRLSMPYPVNNRPQFRHNRTGDCSNGWSD